VARDGKKVARVREVLFRADEESAITLSLPGPGAGK
jgi:hypothetical protein